MAEELHGRLHKLLRNWESTTAILVSWQEFQQSHGETTRRSLFRFVRGNVPGNVPMPPTAVGSFCSGACPEVMRGAIQSKNFNRFADFTLHRRLRAVTIIPDHGFPAHISGNPVVCRSCQECFLSVENVFCPGDQTTACLEPERVLRRNSQR